MLFYRGCLASFDDSPPQVNNHFTQGAPRDVGKNPTAPLLKELATILAVLNAQCKARCCSLGRVIRYLGLSVKVSTLAYHACHGAYAEGGNRPA